MRETDDVDMLRDALLENLHRSQLNPLEEAAAYHQMLDDFGCTHEELASGSVAPGRRSATRSGCSSSHRPSSAGSPPACSRPGTPAPCSRSRTPRSRTGSRRASSPRASACAGSRRSSRSARPGRPSPSYADDKPTAPGLADLAERLSDRFETRVKVDLGQRKGKITVEFASLDDLQRIVDIMDPRNRNDRPI